jgi:hypothetical protein
LGIVGALVATYLGQAIGWYQAGAGAGRRLARSADADINFVETEAFKAFGRPRVPAETEQRIRDALATPGRPGFHKIAAQFGVATGTVQRIAQG